MGFISTLSHSIALWAAYRRVDRLQTQGTGNSTGVVGDGVGDIRAGVAHGGRSSGTLFVAQASYPLEGLISICERTIRLTNERLI